MRCLQLPFVRRFVYPFWLSLALSLLMPCGSALATGVPIEGFLPQVGFALTNEFNDDLQTMSFPSNSPSGILLGANGTPHYDVALLDTGAGLSVLTHQADLDFDLAGPYPGEPDGFRGTFTVGLGGATGGVDANVNDPVGLYAGGLQDRTSSGPLVMNHTGFQGQTNTSLVTVPAESDLPNVVGLTFASQYATHINADEPQVFELNGRTVRTPSIDFQPLGSGGGGIARRAPLSLQPGDVFAQAPSWVYDFNNPDFLDKPYENPMFPTLLPGALFLNANIANGGNQLNNSQLFFDSGASVSVLSELKALQLGIDVQSDAPEFTVDIVGSGGLTENLPGYYIDSLTIQALGGSVTATNVPVIIEDITNPANPGNIVDGIIGTNLLVGRNLVIDPNPALGGGGNSPSLYISDPVTNHRTWSSTAASGTWGTASRWNASAVPDILSVTNVRNNSGADQQVSVAADASAWEVNVSGTQAATMTLQIQAVVKLTTFSGANVEAGGEVKLAGGTLDAQFVEIFDGSLTGNGLVTIGSGPVPGQLENRSGTVSVGDGNAVGTLTIEGRFSNGVDAALHFDIGGTAAGAQHDQLVVDGQAKLGGTLQVDLADLGDGTFTPSPGDEFTLLTSTKGLGGAFDTLLLPADDAYDWLVDYGTNDLTLIAILPGDFDNNGGVNGGDLTAWQDGYGQQPNRFDGGDFLTWQQNFGNGEIASSAVPEPGGAALLALAAFAVGIRRKW